MKKKALNIREGLEKLTDSQINIFGAVVSWFQIHNNLYYFLDERNANKLFIDLFVSKTFKRLKNEEKINKIIEHINLYKIPNTDNILMSLIENVLENKTIKELNDIAWTLRD